MGHNYLIGYIETKEKRFLESSAEIKKAVLNSCVKLGLKVVAKKSHIFSGLKGVTYCFILSQSHFVIHTWPEVNKIYFDIFTCNMDLDIEECKKILSKEFVGAVKGIRKIEQ